MAYTDEQPGYFENSLKKLAKDKGYQLNYDETSDLVSVLNPTTNKSISFKSGQGQEYGMSGLVDGYNTVGDADKLSSALGASDAVPSATTVSSAPKTNANYAVNALNKATSSSTNRQKADDLLSTISSTTTAGKTPSDYQQQIDDIMNMIKARTNMASVAYDPASDTAYQTYRNQALKDADKVSNDITAEYLGAQGGNFNSAATQIAAAAKNDLIDKADAAMSLYEDRYNAKNQQALKDQYNLLDALNKIDTTSYNRGRDKLSDQYSLVDALLKVDQQDYERQDQDRKDYTENTGYMPVDTSMIPADSPLRQITDYKAEIQRREAINPNDPDIPYLYALRNEKIMALQDTDPAAYEQYKNEIVSVPGIPTLSLVESRQKQAYQDTLNKKAEIETKIKEMEIETLPETSRAEIRKLLAEADRAEILAQYAPEEARAKIDEIYTRTESIIADDIRQGRVADSQIASVGTKKAEAEDEKVYQSNYSEAYARFSSWDASEAVKELTDRYGFYYNQLGPNYYTKLVKDLESKARGQQ
jgi:hypothetical protein